MPIFTLTYIAFWMKFHKKAFSFKADFANLGPRKSINLGEVLEDNNAHMCHSQIQWYTLMILENKVIHCLVKLQEAQSSVSFWNFGLYVSFPVLIIRFEATSHEEMICSNKDTKRYEILQLYTIWTLPWLGASSYHTAHNDGMFPEDSSQLLLVTDPCKLFPYLMKHKTKSAVMLLLQYSILALNCYTTITFRTLTLLNTAKTQLKPTHLEAFTFTNNFSYEKITTCNSEPTNQYQESG